MKISVAVVATIAAFSIGSASASLAQQAPDDAGVGVKLGMTAQNNSGQTGTVTLFQRGSAKTLVVIKLVEEADGHVEPARIHRGRSCDALDPRPAYGLAPVINGVSRTIVDISRARLLSGNYVVNVHGSARNMNDYVSCGELYH